MKLSVISVRTKKEESRTLGLSD